ncbi:phosphatase PAP2 family protein [Chitinophaga filiformis]|uniref:phosphatase PAP2 family protein n=1 Tax=Chitinophaga filiformis TaxID=104663 RepID=UPI001F2BAA43|nr:phosphatase PAP2 family protein [Chitinophaga filiformis]MCF6401987.1 phosphatase PAP2 family protein [Chitinophaga filiformis]
MEQVIIPTTDNSRQDKPVFSPALQKVAEVISYLSHPLFLPILVTVLLVNAMPEYFVLFKQESIRYPFDLLYIRVLFTTLFLPLFVVALCKALGFVTSFQLRSQKDRIIPYVACTTFYFWTYFAFKRQGVAPPFFNAFFLGVFIAIVIGMVANTYVKISMHTIGWGGVIGFLLMLMTGLNMNISLALMIAFLISGIVGTARLILGAHTPAEIYTGFILGILSQLIAYGIAG